VTTPQFQQPGSGGDKFDCANFNGHLCLFYPTEYRRDIPTTNGPRDVVDCDIAVITAVNPQTGQPFTFTNARIFGAAMVPQLKGAIPDGMVLGRLIQGQNTKGNPPWLLDHHTDQDVAMAMQYIAAHPRQQFAQPAAQAPAPQAPSPYQVAPGGQQAYTGQGQVAPGTPPTGPAGASPSPQYASAQLPYDPWQGTPAAPAGPPQGAWQPAANAPAPAAVPAATPPQTATGEPQNPALAAYLTERNVNPAGMSNAQMQMIAATFQQ
jgi:hypothetical protein